MERTNNNLNSNNMLNLKFEDLYFIFIFNSLQMLLKEEVLENEVKKFQIQFRSDKKRLKHDKDQWKSGKYKEKSEASNYYWSQRENRSYLKFLMEKGNLMALPPLERKRHKTNLKLSKYIKSRTPTQCHTHHQKMMLKFGSIQNIIQSFLDRLGEQKGEEKVKTNTDSNQPLQNEENEENEDNLKDGQAANLKSVEQNVCKIIKEENELEYKYY